MFTHRLAAFIVATLAINMSQTSHADDELSRVKVHYDQNDIGHSRLANPGVWNEVGDATFRAEQESAQTTEWVLSSPSTASAMLTPLIDLKPVAVTGQTVLSFDLYCSVPGIYKINLTNQQENAWYILHFQVAEASEWLTVRQFVAGATFGRNFKDGHVINDGMLGDHLIRVQIEAKGEQVKVRNFRIYDTPQAEQELPPPAPLDTTDYTKNTFAQFDTDGFFPFGVILTINADIEKNAQHLSQDAGRRMRDTLLDIKRHNFNTISNFVDDSRDAKGRLNLMEQYRLHILETLPAYLELLGETEAIDELYRRLTEHPRLLGWYGRDEPRELQKYLDFKKRAAQLAPQKPYTSAFDVPFVIRSLGPLMEIVMTDLYPLTPHVEDPVEAMVHRMAAQIRMASSTGAKVWSINQAFSLRRSGDQHFLRYPTVEEIRFDFFNSLAAGAEGIFYFIYCDEVPYLDGEMRREEFDTTMVDAWRNPTPSYTELAKLGEAWLPILPSMLGAQETLPYTYDKKRRFVQRVAENEHGQWVVIVNGDLRRERNIPLPASTSESKFYDTLSGTQITEGSLVLAPGEGRIVLATDDSRWAKVQELITRRSLKNRVERAIVTIDMFERAGAFSGEAKPIPTPVNIHNADMAELRAMAQSLEKLLQDLMDSDHPTALRYERLEKIRKNFGIINRFLVEPEQTKRYDGKNLVADNVIFSQIRELSSRYFALLALWQDGDPLFSDTTLNELQGSSDDLVKSVKSHWTTKQ